MSEKTYATPSKCAADICLIPIGTGSPSVSSEVADIQQFLAKSGIKYQMHSAGTTIEGSWDDVFGAIGQIHSMLHEKGVLRIQSDIRVGTRVDKVQSFPEKVAKVEAILRERGGDAK